MFKYCIGTPVRVGGSDAIAEVAEQHTFDHSAHYLVRMPSGSACIYRESELSLPPKGLWPVSFPWQEKRADSPGAPAHTSPRASTEPSCEHGLVASQLKRELENLKR